MQQIAKLTAEALLASACGVIDHCVVEDVEAVFSEGIGTDRVGYGSDEDDRHVFVGA